MHTSLMSRPETQLDADGFPIPERLADGESTPRRGAYKNGNPFKKRWVRALVLLVIFFGIATMLLKDQFPAIMAQWYMQAAVEDLNAGDLESALSNSEGVITWMPEDPRGYYLRGELHRELGDMDAALADLTKAIELQENWLPAISSRANLNLRMKHFEAAVADNTRAIKLSSESEEAMYRNNRAYARALGGFELEDGLADAEAAVDSREKDLEYDPGNTIAKLDLSAYLDTRGFLHHLLGNQEQALEDLNRAIEMIDGAQGGGFQALGVDDQQMPAVAELEQQLDESRAVMYEHRSLVHAKLGDDDAATRDHQRALELGYNPEAGVF